MQIIKRWSAAESFSIFENQVYSHWKNLTFAINFVATPFFGEFFFLMLHKQTFAINFVVTPFLGESFFSGLHKQKFAINYVATPFLGESFFF
jgi:hypothetical protein